MRWIDLGVVLALSVGSGLGAASAASPPEPSSASTPAPVPDVMPRAAGGGGPGAMPQQVAPPALTAGPADATPFSAAPSAQLPPDNAVTLGRDGPVGAQAGPVPNLSK